MLAVAVLLVAAIIIFGVLKLADDRVEEVPVRESQEAVITITADGFVPESIDIQPGDKVVWTNKDTDPHAVASNSHLEHDILPDLKSDTLGPDESYTYVFEEAGIFEFHDEYKPEHNAVITVGE